jgi:hypothetical protein
MIDHIRVLNATGAVAIATTLAPGRSFKISEVRLHLSAAGGAVGDVNFTATVDAISGAPYDFKILSQDMTLLTDYSYVPTRPLQFEAGDEIDFAYANGGSKTYGLTVIYELL